MKTTMATMTKATRRLTSYQKLLTMRRIASITLMRQTMTKSKVMTMRVNQITKTMRLQATKMMMPKNQIRLRK